MNCLSSSSKASKKAMNFSAFGSVRALKGLDDAYPHWGEQSILVSPLIGMLISSENTLTDTPRNKV